MSVTYRLKVSELDENLLAALKAKYGEQEIEITIDDLKEVDHLLSSKLSGKRIVNAIRSGKQHDHKGDFSWADLESYYYL
ncbi:hypothetical protein PCC7418_1352 [Halothece sp. PCC 7418]|uniref:hypothetical protein n=1 Tax=Halothece sp. (strain PCC 7418) TaxID=65093 RepID=UPI0002A07283|nr:hypothetical protein [Halothece sp. PCC 7418]AFZ43550.1 hypothetical protein PCC7418_1352 [Halothece sp. PCC 7418]